MNDEQFNAILPLIVSSLASKIITYFGITEESAISLLNASKTYSALENENTKVWHYSADKLFDIFKEEQNGNFELPEY